MNQRPRDGSGVTPRAAISQAREVLQNLIVTLEDAEPRASATARNQPTLAQTPSAVGNRPNVGICQGQPSEPSSSAASASEVLAEHQRLFFSYRLARGGGPRGVQRGSSRRQRTSTAAPYRLPTHTHTLVCLAIKDAELAPAAQEKQELYCRGLGEHRVQFLQTDDSVAVHSKIMKEYPKLAGAGGYEFLQVKGNCRNLVPLPEPPDGYTARYLKTLGSARVFIRPVQHDLPEEGQAQTSTQQQVC